MSNLVGQQLGQYRILEEIGHGGMAIIYRAEQASIGREVAIKVLNRSLIEQDKTFLERFYREAQTVAHLQHPYILPVYDFGGIDDQPYTVMAYMASGTLADHIQRQGQIRLAEAVRVIGQMADALDYAHRQGIIHRDFKPSNILLDEPGNAYLADFGLAKTMRSPQLTASGIVGTPDYMAPDWVAVEGVSEAVDIYAMGVTLYQMLAGEVPFRASTPMAVVMAHLNNPIPDVRNRCADLPEAVQNVIATAMAKSRSDRYPTAGDLFAALKAAAETARRQIVPPSLASSPSQEPFFFPAAHMRLNLLAAKDVLGETAFHGVLLLVGLEDLIGSFPPDDMQQNYPVESFRRLWQGIYEVYGARGLQAVGKLVGHRVQTYGAASPQGKMIYDAAKNVMKALSLEEKVLTGLSMLVRFYSNQNVEVEETPEYWIWRVHRCANCWGWQADEPVCYSWIGYLKAELTSATGRKFHIVETECRARGDSACVFVISKKMPDSV